MNNLVNTRLPWKGDVERTENGTKGKKYAMEVG
jgi:hypothetical protein